MKEIKLTRDFFLWCMSIVYLSAFSSFYHQIPGLYGDNGILPASAVVPLEAEAKVIQAKTKEVPTLLWLAPVFGINVPLMMDFIALLGIIVSFGCIVWGRMRDMTNFALLWMLYFSLFQVGQTFLWFQWDILLLEAGFLTILLAPLGFFQSSIKSGFFTSLPHRPHDTVSLWLVRWLLFRLMFQSGIVKLSSMCPTWWNLTALAYHFESQCIPTPLARYAHYIPLWFLKLGVVGSYIIEIAIPFLFFFPIRSLRIFSFYSQLLLQFFIILTGNYNFFNLLTVALCFSLIDDEFLLNLVGRSPISSTKSTRGTGLRWMRVLLVKSIELVIFVGIIYWTVNLFSLKFSSDWTVQSSVVFTAADFKRTLSGILPATIFIGVLSLTGNIALAFYRSFKETGTTKKIFSLFSTIFISIMALFVFSISLVPYTSIDVKTQSTLWPVLHKWHRSLERYEISNAYGLFRRMTGTDGRPEIVIEGSNSMTSGWKEYHFLYKPGDLSNQPSFIMPHQPRLDWQMWFAALSDFENNPWFVSFMYRLLDGQKEVIDLLDKDRLPFPANKPPKFIRAILYKYNYAPLKAVKKNKDWWVRRKVREYFNSSDLDENQMLEILNAAGIPMEKTRHLRVTNMSLKKYLTNIRNWTSDIRATTLIWSLLGSALTVNLLSPILRFSIFR